MRSRIYHFLVILFALALINTTQAKADGKGKPDQGCNVSKNDNDKKDSRSDKNLPINTAVGALLVAGAGIGVIAIRKAKSANKAV